MFAVIARTDPNEQESVMLMPELDAVPDRRHDMTGLEPSERVEPTPRRIRVRWATGSSPTAAARCC